MNVQDHYAHILRISPPAPLDITCAFRHHCFIQFHDTPTLVNYFHKLPAVYFGHCMISNMPPIIYSEKPMIETRGSHSDFDVPSTSYILSCTTMNCSYRMETTKPNKGGSATETKIPISTKYHTCEIVPYPDHLIRPTATPNCIRLSLVHTYHTGFWS